MKKITIALLAIAITMAAKANNIQLANIGISGQNTAGHYSLIGFDVNWENSWRVSNNENNYDAAWMNVVTNLIALNGTVVEHIKVAAGSNIFIRFYHN